MVKNHGWSWSDTQDFLLKVDANDNEQSLPEYMEEVKKMRITIRNAMMLDGGGSTSFGYRWRDKNGKIAKEYYVDTTRKIPTIVQAWAESPR